MIQVMAEEEELEPALAQVLEQELALEQELERVLALAPKLKLMSITKSDISNNIAFRTSLSNEISKSLFEKFTQIIIHNTKNKTVKINNFGTFL